MTQHVLFTKKNNSNCNNDDIQRFTHWTTVLLNTNNCAMSNLLNTNYHALPYRFFWMEFDKKSPSFEAEFAYFCPRK